eukprot:1757701-Rhodomonas_salina.1
MPVRRSVLTWRARHCQTPQGAKGSAPETRAVALQCETLLVAFHAFAMLAMCFSTLLPCDVRSFVRLEWWSSDVG